MIPDDGVIVVRQKVVSVKEADGGVGMTVRAASSGFPGTYDVEALAHVYAKNNPHADGLMDIKLPENNGGKWFKVGEAGVAVTDEEPLYAEDIHPVVSEDGLVRADAAGPNLTLASVVGFPFCEASGLRLRGDEKYAPRMFYGTDAAGTVGFNVVPGKAVVV